MQKPNPYDLQIIHAVKTQQEDHLRRLNLNLKLASGPTLSQPSGRLDQSRTALAVCKSSSRSCPFRVMILK